MTFSTRPHNLTENEKIGTRKKRRKRKADDGNDYGKRKKVIEIFSDGMRKKTPFDLQNQHHPQEEGKFPTHLHN